MTKQTQNTQHDFRGLTSFFQAFASGKRTDSKGNTKTWTNDELDEIVSNTKARAEKNLFSGAPFVVGHPKTNSPSFGWLLDIKREGDDLLVKADEKTLHKEFAEGVETGRYPNRSVRIAKDKKGYYLAHVGFLGAAPPAVEGMDAIYAANEGECWDYAEADTYTPNVLTRLMRGMRDFFIEQFGIETADRVIPGYDIDALGDHVDRLREQNNAEPTSSFIQHAGDNSMPREYTEAEIAQIKKDAADEAKKNADAEFAKKESDYTATIKTEREQRLRSDFGKQIDGLVGEGRLTPAQTEGMVDFMIALDAGEVTEFEFSAGEGDKAEKKKASPLAWFTEFAKRIGKQVDMGESDASKDLRDATTSDFVLAHDASVDADRLALHKKAVEYQASHQGVEYIDAVRIVEQQES